MLFPKSFITDTPKSSGSSNADDYTEENRSRLARILKAAWVRNQEEINYYISEFDLLIKQQINNKAPVKASLFQHHPQRPLPLLATRTHSERTTVIIKGTGGTRD